MEYKQRLKEQIGVLEAYNRGVLFGNSPGATSWEIATLGLHAAIKGDVEKEQVSERGKYLATAFLISSDRRRYSELILLLKSDYAKQQNNYPKNITDIYGLMVAFESTRPTSVTRGDGDHGGGGGAGRKIEYWRCGGNHMKRDFPKRTKDKENKEKDREDVKNKRVEVTGGQVHAMFTSSGDVP